LQTHDFHEKVVFKMLHDRRPLLTRMADKVQARDYVAEKIGAQFLSRVYQICSSADDIDWQRLPQSFVIKANHGCRMNIFIRDKSEVNVAEVSSQLKSWLNTNFYFLYREWCYRDVRPLIMIEELLAGEQGRGLLDWKFWVFHGRVKYLEVGMGPRGKRTGNIYDRQLRRVNVRLPHRSNDVDDPVFPVNIETMFSLAETLASGLDFLRVDLYNVDGRIVFGELTNYPGAGRHLFTPPEFDEVIGRNWQCPARYS